jgi:hypothetical protein
VVRWIAARFGLERTIGLLSSEESQWLWQAERAGSACPIKKAAPPRIAIDPTPSDEGELAFGFQGAEGARIRVFAPPHSDDLGVGRDGTASPSNSRGLDHAESAVGETSVDERTAIGLVHVASPTSSLETSE